MKVYDMVTNRIIEQLKEGIIPWERPWILVNSGAFNRKTRKQYSLLNQMLLKHSGEYATFKQWQELGGKIKKGAKSEKVFFWQMKEVLEKTEKEKCQEETKDMSEQKTSGIRIIPIMKYYNVFHISQVEGVEPIAIDIKEKTHIEKVQEAEDILQNYLQREKITLDMCSRDEAYYSSSLDGIFLPLRDQFKTKEKFYGTAFHEAVHSTLKEKRCNRPNKNSVFGNEDYSKEELVAEIGSCMILNSLGLETEKSFRNTTAYIQGWIKKLKNDSRFIVSASSMAEKAVKYILNTENNEDVNVYDEKIA